MADGAGSVDRIIRAEGFRTVISSIDGTIEGACSNFASLSSNASKRCGISNDSGLSIWESRSPICAAALVEPVDEAARGRIPTLLGPQRQSVVDHATLQFYDDVDSILCWRFVL